MNREKLINEISKKDVDVKYYANKIIEEDQWRKEVLHQLLTNKDIMVYYHCYYIVSKASEERPELFYPYWMDFASLLHHKNSYHRDIGITIIANLVRVDKEHYFDSILEEYLKGIKDDKFMTAGCLVKNLIKVVKSRDDLRENILQTLLVIDIESPYPEKQRELLKYDILQIFDLVYNETELKEDIKLFIKSTETSRSPKTKKKAKELIKKYSIK